MGYNIQNTITIRRLRSSDNLSLSFDSNNIPLFQAIEEVSEAVAPDWTVPENQPIRAPKITSTQGAVVEFLLHKWAYNGIPLNFNGATTNDWTTDSTGRFQINENNGSIKIIANLASPSNIADDLLSYEAVVRVSGVEYTMHADITISIQKMGASSYEGRITAGTHVLDSQTPSTEISTQLWQGVTEITAYSVKWYKFKDLWSDKTGKTITVDRDDVGGSQLIIAEFIVEGSVVAREAVKITDNTDEYLIALSIISENKEVYKDPNGTHHNVTVEARIVSTSTSPVATPTNEVWRLDVMSHEDWVSLKSSTTNTIEVTPNETDRNGQFFDVDVLADVEFTI